MAATTEPSRDEQVSDSEPPLQSGGARDRAATGGFLAPYKSGQGYWTRMGTAIGAALVLGFTLLFLYREALPHFGVAANSVKLGICGAVTLVVLAVAWWLMNAPSRAQFLIDTDSEMKKVNWASRKELVASTKVVIFFMVIIALALFVFDQQFHGLFYMLRAYTVPPNTTALQVTGLIFTVVLAGVGYLIWHGADAPRPKFWGMVMLAVGAVGAVAWGAWTLLTVLGVAGAATVGSTTAPL